MESQFGIAHVWTQGDFVMRSVAIMLLVMSVASGLVIIIKALALVKFKKFARQARTSGTEDLAPA
jgi:biopolymer transport protein ExbB